MKREKLKKYLQWDIDTFGIGLKYIIDLVPPSHPGQKALELGANYGGISVCLVNEKGYDTLCTDLEDPKQKVVAQHPEIQNDPRINFDSVDGLNIKYDKDSFDLVIFKSVLGYIDSKEKQQLFINEIYRVLKPGGYFCFLENAKASGLHRLARKKFVSWGENWRYVTLSEMKEFLSPFKAADINANGFFTAFAKTNKLKYMAYLVDRIMVPVIPKSQRYVMYGIAVK